MARSRFVHTSSTHPAKSHSDSGISVFTGHALSVTVNLSPHPRRFWTA
jgi:hypothetical protein